MNQTRELYDLIHYCTKDQNYIKKEIIEPLQQYYKEINEIINNIPKKYNNYKEELLNHFHSLSPIKTDPDFYDIIKKT